jgi:hypothetical protein
MKNERIAATCSPVACSYYLICWLGPRGSQREKGYPSTPLLVSSPNVRSIDDLRFPVKLALHRGRAYSGRQNSEDNFFTPAFCYELRTAKQRLSFAKSGKHRRIRAINQFCRKILFLQIANKCSHTLGALIKLLKKRARLQKDNFDFGNRVTETVCVRQFFVGRRAD